MFLDAKSGEISAQNETAGLAERLLQGPRPN
jgi:hypothetical protein